VNHIQSGSEEKLELISPQNFTTTIIMADQQQLGAPVAGGPVAFGRSCYNCKFILVTFNFVFIHDLTW
jgi:hypothetical protein